MGPSWRRQLAARRVAAGGGHKGVVGALLEKVTLTPYADRVCGSYSGGNKRKLCVGIALIGRPQLVLLDEPSSGMDAASKRFLWAVIKRRTSDCCTILTTLSMEECESLCGRLGVMVDGTLRCLGPIPSRKPRHGPGARQPGGVGLCRAI